MVFYSVRFACAMLTCLIISPTLFGQPRVDALGDPLPEGAIARVGTTRMRHFSFPDRLCFGLGCMAWSPDGKMIATTSFFSGRVGAQAKLWDANGKTLSVLENNELYGPSFIRFSPNNKTLAAAGREKIILWDVATGRELGQLLGHATEVDALAYQEAGNTIVSVSADGVVLWWDAATRKTVREWHILAKEPKKNDKGEPFDMRIYNARFSNDGTILALEKWWTADKGFRRAGATMAIVFDLKARKELWREDTNGYGCTFAFTSDGKRLVMSGGSISLRDTPTGNQLALMKEIGNAWGMDYSPNGKTVAIATGGGIAFWSPNDKVPLRHYPINESSTAPSYSPDGKRVAVSSSLTFRILDADNGKPVVLWPGFAFGDSSKLPLSVNGRSLFAPVYDPTAWAYHTAAIDTATWRQVSALKDESKKFPGFQSATPDQTMCVARDGKHRDALVDMKTGKVLTRLDAPDVASQLHQGFFSTRATMYVKHDLSQRNENNTLEETDTLFAIPSGKRLCQLRLKDWTFAWTFSADESRVAFVEWTTGIIRVHATDDGKLVWKSAPVQGKWRWVWSALALSPDGNLLAAQTENAGVVQVWDLKTGKLHRSLTPGVREFHSACLAWSPDNRVLAVGGFDNTVQLWEVASGQIRREFRGHMGPARCLTYLPDGELLVSGSEDATLLVWKTLPDKKTGDSLSADALAALWENLRAEASRASEALAELRQAPKSAVPFLAKHLQPESAADANQVSLWLRDLDSKNFEVRDKATKELEHLGELARDAIRKELAVDHSVEMRRRLERLLEKANHPTLSRLRCLRAIEVLETLASPEAIRILERVALGNPDGILTIESRAVVERLKTKGLVVK